MSRNHILCLYILISAAILRCAWLFASVRYIKYGVAAMKFGAGSAQVTCFTGISLAIGQNL